MKRFFMLVFLLSLILSLLVPVGMAADATEPVGKEEVTESISALEEAAVYRKATLEDDFREDRVIVILKHAYSEVNAEIDVENFETSKIMVAGSIRSRRNAAATTSDMSQTIEIASVQDLMVIEETDGENSLVDTDNFKQILSLKLANPGKEKVLEAISELEKLDMVWAAVPDYNYEIAEDYTPNDPYFNNTYQWGAKKISAEGAWDITTGNSNIKVGVFESGIASHSDLNTHVQSGNFTPSADADLSHGTHVAGIIGAVINNGVGIAGMAQVSLILLDRSDFVNSLTYAMNNNISVINASFYYALSDGETPASSHPVHEAAIGNYNGLLVCSAGNEGKILM